MRAKKTRRTDKQNKENEPMDSNMSTTTDNSLEDYLNNSQRNTISNYNIETTNRFETLKDITNTVETDPQTEEDVLKQIRESNARSQSSRQESRTQGTTTEPSGSNSSQPKAAQTNEVQNNSSRPQAANGREKRKEDRPPPINILYQNPKDTERLIIDKLGQVSFLIKRINGSKHSLQMSLLTEIQNAKKWLGLANTCFYTFTPKKEKMVTVLLKGLHHSYEPDEI